MKRNFFTIPELLVGMALMMFLVNLLASIYTQFSSMSIQQATSLNSYLKINQTLNYIENDIANMLTKGEAVKPASGSMNRPRSVLLAGYMNNATINKTQGWPKLTFTTRHIDPSSGTTNSSDGYIDVIYNLTYDNNNSSGLVDSSGNLSLHRNTSTNKDHYYLEDGSLSDFSSNVILENVTYFGFYFSSNLMVWDSSATNSFNISATAATDQYEHNFPDFINIILAVNQSHGTSEMRLTLDTPLSIPKLNANSSNPSPYININGEVDSGVSILKENYSITQYNGQAQGVGKVLTGIYAGEIVMYSTEYNTNGSVKQLWFAYAPSSKIPSGTSLSLSIGDQIQILQTFTRRCIVPK